MRKIGKFLVFANLVLSLLFLGWALALYTQRLDWAPHKNMFTGEVNLESGKLYHLLEDVKLLVEQRDLAETRFNADEGKLHRLFDQRTTYNKWYADQLSLARTGLDTTGKKDDPEDYPVRRLVRDPKDPNGLLIRDPKQREPVKDSRNVAVRSIGECEQEYKKLLEELKTLQADIAKLITYNAELTKEIAGYKDEKGTVQSRGIRGQLEDRNTYKKLWEDEVAYLRPHVVNQLINVEQQKRRLAALEGRLKELQPGVVAGKAP